ncbi:hypothetical protein [Paenibacillus pabuli]|uniref:hypothetical protein n=1 Tax=Paenibacillus pabuli TaxID=1472 RepID=UPI0032B4BE7A
MANVVLAFKYYNVITGAKSLDKDWEDYVKGLGGLNIQRYVEIMQSSYDSSSISK